VNGWKQNLLVVSKLFLTDWKLGLTFFYVDGELVGGVDIVSHRGCGLAVVVLWKGNECKSEDVQEMVESGDLGKIC
jgi:hypothetical protein